MQQPYTGYRKKSTGELLRIIEECKSINQLFALVQHEGIVIQMKPSENAASNIPFTPLKNGPDILPLEKLKRQVKDAVLQRAKVHSKEQLIRAVETCPSIDKLFELVKNEHIVIQMKSQQSASCLPAKVFSEADFNPEYSPLDKLKDQVKAAIIYGG